MARSRARRATKPIEQSSRTKSFGIEKRPILVASNGREFANGKHQSKRAGQDIKARRTALLTISLVVSLLMSVVPALAQTTIRLDELPNPPADLKRLIDAGNVKFQVGTNNGQTELSGAASDLDGKNSTSAGQIKMFAAETHFQIRFDYDAQIIWRVIDRLSELRITATLRRFEWQPSHTVWFRDRPATEDFWSNPLVLHEFDHISLSTDPRMKARFDELRKEPTVIRQPLSNGERVNRQLVDRLVKEHLLGLHQEVLDLIEIRYRELDRETAHGREALSQDSPLEGRLREIRAAISER